MTRIITSLSAGIALAAASMMRMQQGEAHDMRKVKAAAPSVNIWARYNGGPQPTGKADKWELAKRKQKAKAKAAHRSRMAQKRKNG